MFQSVVPFLKWIVLAVAGLMYFFVILFQEKKVWFTSLAAVLCIVLGIVFPGVIFPAESAEIPSRLFAITNAFSSLINWNVLMIYVGAMTIASLFLYSKIPTKIADFLISDFPMIRLDIWLNIFLSHHYIFFFFVIFSHLEILNW